MIFTWREKTNEYHTVIECYCGKWCIGKYFSSTKGYFMQMFLPGTFKCYNLDIKEDEMRDKMREIANNWFTGLELEND